MDPNFRRNMQRTIDKHTADLEKSNSMECSQTSRAISPATTNTSTSSKSPEKSKLRGWFSQWCPTDPNSVSGGKVDQSGGYFTYKLKEEPKPAPRKQRQKKSSRQHHLEALVEE